MNTATVKDRREVLVHRLSHGAPRFHLEWLETVPREVLYNFFTQGNRELEEILELLSGTDLNQRRLAERIQSRLARLADRELADQLTLLEQQWIDHERRSPRTPT